jgi:hypothetical protein
MTAFHSEHRYYNQVSIETVGETDVTYILKTDFLLTFLPVDL